MGWAQKPKNFRPLKTFLFVPSPRNPNLEGKVLTVTSKELIIMGEPSPTLNPTPKREIFNWAQKGPLN